MKRCVSLLLVLALVFGIVPWALAADEAEITYTGTITGGSLHLRKEPNASAKVLNTYKKGTKVEILENDGAWCKVKAGGKTGYMMAQYLDIEANYPHLGWAKTTDDGTVLNVRAQADGSSEIIFMCMSGAVFELVEEKGDWYRVRAGAKFGYLPKAKCHVMEEGEFALGLSAGGDGAPITAAGMYSAVREMGNPRKTSRDEGDFTYSISYPALGIAAADEKIEAWIQEKLTVFEADFRQNHAGGKASFTVEYQALNVDSRYQSVLLFGEYKAGGLKAETALALNIDAGEGKLLSPERDFFRDEAQWALFCLDSAAGSVMSTPTDGYAGKPDTSWLKYAVLARDGLQVFLPAGLYLPAAFGTQRLLLSYAQLADRMTLSSPVIAAHLRVIDPAKPMIALTFDDGPSEYTDRILKVLAEYNARATFCVIGNKVETYGDVIKRAVAQGNEIACHTWNHTKLTTLSAASIRSQIERTNNAVRELTGGYEIKVLRPPYGSVNKNVRTVCAELDMVIAHWKIDTEDWSTRNSTKTYNAIMKGSKNGVIILCHDLYMTTAAAAEKAIPKLIEKGFQLVTVSELLSFHKDGAQPGTVYSYLDPENIVTAGE